MRCVWLGGDERCRFLFRCRVRGAVIAVRCGIAQRVDDDCTFLMKLYLRYDDEFQGTLPINWIVGYV